MLLFITGASGAGKTAVIPGLRKRLMHFDIHDFDERGVPAEADTRWRQQETEVWINRAIENQRLGRDTVVCGGAVFGEILACPSVSQIDHLGVCLLDCDDIVRLDRMRKFRGEEPTMDLLAWAAWQRVHAVDPTWCPEVITRDGFDAMRWDQWREWERGDPRWQVSIIDTGHKKIEQITAEVARWIEGEVAAKDTNPVDPLTEPGANGSDGLLREEDG